MAIYLDDEAVSLPGADLAAVLAAARDRLASQGRVITEVKWNGESLVGEALTGRQSAALADADLRLYTSDARALARGTLEEVRRQLAQAREGFVTAGQSFQQDQTSQAMQQLGQAMAVWTHAPKAVLQTAQLCGLAIDQVRIEGQAVDQLAQALKERLQDLRDRLWARDTVALADALLYEWPAVSDRWLHLMDALLQRLD